MEIRTETKEAGSWSQYVEIGTYESDAFGDQRFRRKGYAQHTPDLKVQRKWEGTGTARYCRWIIGIPEGYPYTIRRVTNPGGQERHRKYDVLYSPQN